MIACVRYVSSLCYKCLKERIRLAVTSKETDIKVTDGS